MNDKRLSTLSIYGAISLIPTMHYLGTHGCVHERRCEPYIQPSILYITPQIQLAFDDVTDLYSFTNGLPNYKYK